MSENPYESPQIDFESGHPFGPIFTLRARFYYTPELAESAARSYASENPFLVLGALLSAVVLVVPAAFLEGSSTSLAFAYGGGVLAVIVLLVWIALLAVNSTE